MLEVTAPPPDQYTTKMVEHMLYRAGATLIALKVPGCWPAEFRSCMPEPLGTVADDTRFSPPASRLVSEMDRVLEWVKLIPSAELRLRLVVNARMLCNPRTRKPWISFEKIGEQLGVSHTTARSYWHKGTTLITAALNRPLFCHHPAFLGTKRLVPTHKVGVSAATRRVLAREDVLA